MSENKDDKRVFLTPAGAIIALICFFLPWVKVSCAGKVNYLSGAEIGGIFWLVLITALAIIVAFFYFRNQKKIEKSRPVAILGSIITLAVILIKYVSLAWEQKSVFAKAGSKVIDCTIQIGAVGTVIGFVMAVVGAGFLKTGCDKRKGVNP